MRSYLLDANLLVLLVVGSYDRALIERHKRCRQFDFEDYELLCALLEKSEILTTPHVLAEASNLVRQTGQPLQSALTSHLAHIIGSLTENYVTSRDAIACGAYVRLGLNDTTVLSSSSEHELLTTDYDLYFEALSCGRQVTNFTHHRERIAPR